MKDRVKVWLESFSGMDAPIGIEAITVTIGDESWEGARYHQHGREKYYLVGKLPKDWENTNQGRVYFTLFGQEYYITAFMQDCTNLQKRHLRYHPFGNTWIMSPWTHDDAPDASHETPCKRQEMKVS